MSATPPPPIPPKPRRNENDTVPLKYPQSCIPPQSQGRPPQNYGGQPNYYPGKAYYPTYPGEITPRYHENYGPPSIQYPMPNHQGGYSHYVPEVAFHPAHNPPHTGPETTPKPELVMPDFHTYINNPSGHPSDSNSQPPRSPQLPPRHTQEPYDAYPTDPNYSNSHDQTQATQQLYSNGSASTSQGPSQTQVHRQPSNRTAANSKTSYLNGIHGLMNPALLSNIALAFRAAVNLGTHVKGALEYPDSFTGKDAVSTIYSLLPSHLARRVALSMARSLEAQLYFHSINWSTIGVVQDTEDEVYQFLNEDSYSPTALDWDEDFPTGVFPVSAKCYSPRCGEGCYSRTCANYVRSADEPLPPPPLPDPSLTKEDGPSGTDNADAPAPTSPQDRTWVGSVPKEILETVSKEEKKRQEIIFETIYTEDDYIKDLDLLENLFMKGLREVTPPIIPQAQIENFIQAVFFNVFKIRTHNQKMLERLQKRQKENYVVQSIGDIFCDSAMEFGRDYVDYNGHFPIADNSIKGAKLKNPEFKRFLEDCSRNKEARKLDFRHFIQRPTTRLQRYTLFLEQIIKYTSDDNPDKGLLEGALQTIRNLCKESDNRVHEAEQRLKILDLEMRLMKKNGDPCTELKLMDINRQLLHKGDLHKRNAARLDFQELHLFLFDHYLVMTKKKKGADGEMKYIVSKKPIPLEMLIVDVSNDQRNSTKRRPPIPGGGNGTFVTNIEGSDNRANNPFTIEHVGRHGGTYVLYADSFNTKKMWKEKIQDAQTKLQLKESNNHVFELFTLNDSTFKLGQVGTPGSGATGISKGKVTCSVPFVTPEKRRMVAIGTEEGVWMGFGGEVETFQRVLTVGNVTQMAVIENYGIFVVLVDKALWAYSLEALIPSSSGNSNNSASRQRLCSSNNVQYFNVGTIKDKTLLVFMRRRGIESHFKVMEPVHAVGSGNEKAKSSTSRRLGGLMSSKNDWFKEYKQFYIPSESYHVNFLRSKLCVVCARGFEIMNLETFQNHTIPDFMNPSFAAIARQCDGSKPLGMFRLSDNEFLLCYTEIFFHVDKYGELSRKNVVEWEGYPEAVALRLPYVIGFSSSFIEIRDVETGELIQPILGRNLRCLNDNFSGKQAIHAVMQHPMNDDVQYVFQLVLAEERRIEHSSAR